MNYKRILHSMMVQSAKEFLVKNVTGATVQNVTMDYVSQEPDNLDACTFRVTAILRTDAVGERIFLMVLGQAWLHGIEITSVIRPCDLIWNISDKKTKLMGLPGLSF